MKKCFSSGISACSGLILFFVLVTSANSSNIQKYSNSFLQKTNSSVAGSSISNHIHLRQKRRKHGDTHSQLKMKALAREFIKYQHKSENNTGFEQEIKRNKSRQKRYQYDEDYDWENGGLDYQDRFQKKDEESKFEKWAKNWQKNALKFIFLFSFVMMICCCCCGCIKKLCVKTKGTICFHLREWRDLCLCRDPTYRRMRQMADEYGFELDYSMYKQIKENYERGLESEGYGKVDLSGRK